MTNCFKKAYSCTLGLCMAVLLAISAPQTSLAQDVTLPTLTPGGYVILDLGKISDFDSFLATFDSPAPEGVLEIFFFDALPEDDEDLWDNTNKSFLPIEEGDETATLSLDAIQNARYIVLRWTPKDGVSSLPLSGFKVFLGTEELLFTVILPTDSLTHIRGNIPSAGQAPLATSK